MKICGGGSRKRARNIWKRLFKRGDCRIHIGAVVCAHRNIDAAVFIVAHVHDRVAEDFSVRHNGVLTARRVHRGGEDANLFDGTGLAANFDEVADLKRTKYEQHHTRGEIAERALKGQANGKTSSTDNRSKGCGLNTKDPENRKPRTNQNKRARQSREKARQRGIEAAF